MSTFLTRRDSSTNNVPTVGYNEAVDAQDVLLFGARKIVSTYTTDGNGSISTGFKFVSINGIIDKDVSGVPRGRNMENEIVVKSQDEQTTYYAGSVNAEDGTLKVYTNVQRATVLSSTSVKVTFYARVPIAVDSNGNVSIVGGTTLDVNVVGSSDNMVSSSDADAQLPAAMKMNMSVDVIPDNGDFVKKVSGARSFSAEEYSMAPGAVRTLSNEYKAYICSVVLSHDGTSPQRFKVANGTVAGTYVPYFWVQPKTTVQLDLQSCIKGTSLTAFTVSAHPSNTETVNVNYLIMLSKLV